MSSSIFVVLILPTGNLDTDVRQRRDDESVIEYQSINTRLRGSSKNDDTSSSRQRDTTNPSLTEHCSDDSSSLSSRNKGEMTNRPNRRDVINPSLTTGVPCGFFCGQTTRSDDEFDRCFDERGCSK
eukprot:scaffold29178_cov63-Cyclotella_meneghiniana.AAC.3